MDNRMRARARKNSVDYDKLAPMQVPDFSDKQVWFNAPPLSFKRELKGKLVVLDFWTFCCINCMHVLPELALLEKKYQDEPVVFIGVHSAKFANEQEAAQVKEAVLRYEVAHPVVNDPDRSLWNALGIRAWPTLAVVGPEGELLDLFSGEGRGPEIDRALQKALKKYHPQLNRAPLPLALEKMEEKALRFPGKVACGKHLYISDSNHNRLVVADFSGKILEVIGSGKKGFNDGSYREGSFYRPQGVAYHSNKLYVADAENHALRKVDLIEKQIRTLSTPPLSTPWDLCVIEPFLFIAMAGRHQIWGYNLMTGACGVYSGSGAELNYNSDDLLRAGWAQPSGITYGAGYLFIADSESSTIRAIDLKEGVTLPLVGGDPLYPQNLFVFGDRPGVGSEARLQHPLGVLFVPSLKKVVVADSYNHRLKLLDPQKGEIVNWVGTGEPGFRDGKEAQFAEPAGLALSPDEKTVFVADTNNHAIRTISVETGMVNTLPIERVENAAQA